MRHLAWFFVLGALLLLGKQTLRSEPHELATLQVVVKESVSAEQLEHAIDEAVLVEQAIGHGGALVDPVVREQLLSSMREQPDLSVADDDAALLQRALALGLHRADPVTRQRLVFQAEQLLTASTMAHAVDDTTLEAYLHAHHERYRWPDSLTFRQITFARAKLGDQLVAAATSLLETLRSAPRDAEHARGDPTLLPRDLIGAPPSTVAARFGPDFVTQLAALPSGVWSGPVHSAYGLHLVFVHERVVGAMPALATVRSRVLADYLHDHRRALLRERLHALRGQYRVEVRRMRS